MKTEKQQCDEQARFELFIIMPVYLEAHPKGLVNTARLGLAQECCVHTWLIPTN